MPSQSSKQARFMAAAAHNAAFASKAGISQKVAKEFNQADKGSPFLNAARNVMRPRKMATPQRFAGVRG